MEKEKKTRKSPVWDPIKKLTRRYGAQVREAHREIDLCAKTGRSGRITTPSYVKDVILPLSKSLCEILPEMNLSVNEKVETFGAKDGYYMVSSGEQILGGLSYPGPGVNHINFRVFAHGKPWGMQIEIKKLSQLTKILTELLAFLGPLNNVDDDS